MCYVNLLQSIRIIQILSSIINNLMIINATDNSQLMLDVHVAAYIKLSARIPYTHVCMYIK